MAKLSGITCLVGKLKFKLSFYLRVHWLSEYRPSMQVHPENFRCIVAALRAPGWFRHYQGLKRLASSGRALGKFEIMKG